jgi:hypothetical protein
MNWLDRHAKWFAPALYAAIMLLQFNSLLWSTSRLVSSPSCDMQAQFIGSRAFGFGHLKAGELPLWNPHTYGGEPCLGNFQNALLYPLNWIHLFLPNEVAINWSVAIHVVLAGYFTFLWAQSRGISGSGSILSGLVFMFCGPYFLHVFAGHLPHVCVMVWTPLMLCAVEGLARTGKMKWVLLGVTATAMQILAGHPQYVYYTGLIVSLYTLILSVISEHRVKLLGGVAIMYVGAACLSAIQLLPGLEAADESIRGGGGMPYSFAAILSFPPINWLTMIAPQWFGGLPVTGDRQALQYWALGYQWEASIFIGVIPTVLAMLGLSRLRQRAVWPLILLGGVGAVLAMGRYTPLHQLLYNYLPKFNSFRGTSKFLYVTALVLSMLAGMGLERIAARPRVNLAFLIFIASVGIAMLVVGMQIDSSGHDNHGGWSQLLADTRDIGTKGQELWTYHAPDYAKPDLITRSATQAANSSLQAGLMLLLAASVCFAARYHRLVPVALLSIALIELVVFANQSWDTCPSVPPEHPVAWDATLAALPDDQRVLITDLGAADLSTFALKDSLWGYDPNGLKRWAEYMFVTQGESAAGVTQYLFMHKIALPMFQLVRCRYVLTTDPKFPVITVPDPMPIAQLIGTARVEPDRDKMLAQLYDNSFKNRTSVYVEKAPPFELAGRSNSGEVKVVRHTVDELELQADVSSRAMLLVTNPYSRGWRAESTGPSPQDKYEIMPTNWALQGIPVKAGQHHILLYYYPTGFRVGRWITLVSLVALLGVVSVAVYRVRKPQATLDQPIT